MSLAQDDAAFLIGRPEFRRFLHAAIQGAGLLGQQTMASGADGALLAFLEGRRSLGFDLIALAHRGQEQAVRAQDPLGLTTMQAVLDAALSAKEHRLERPHPRTRYDELPDSDDADGTGTDGRDAGGRSGERRPAPPPAVAEPASAPATSPAGVPERYELALDGMTLDNQLLQNADPVLRELGLSNEQAGKLLPLAQGVMQRTQESLLNHFADAAAAQKRAWAEEFAADPEIGGARRAESEHLAARGLDALGFGEGHPFRQALADSGFGNHPDMIRAFRRLGQLLSEDSGFARAHAGSASQRPVWERLYPQEAK